MYFNAIKGNCCNLVSKSINLYTYIMCYFETHIRKAVYDKFFFSKRYATIKIRKFVNEFDNYIPFALA